MTTGKQKQLNISLKSWRNWDKMHIEQLQNTVQTAIGLLCLLAADLIIFTFFFNP